MTSRLLLAFLLTLPFGALCQAPNACCSDATCITCEDIAMCAASPVMSVFDAQTGGMQVCGINHPTTMCSTWWENNTQGVTNGDPATLSNPDGCISSCGDPLACNYDSSSPFAVAESPSCDYGCYGCTDLNACNYSAEALFEDSTCTYADAGYDCNGNCLADPNGDGICDTECAATTAMGLGIDAAIYLFDFDGDPDDDRFFVLTDAGMSLVQSENGGVFVSGQVVDVDDPNAILDVNIICENGTSGADWGGSFKYDMMCVPTTDITDAWMIYIMNSDLSYLTGSGSLEGTNLQLSHAPSNEAFGFQVGEMANDRNCNYGAMGWFYYNGMVNGVEIIGGTGDVHFDLECGIMGCSDSTACNFNPSATVDDGSCTYTDGVCQTCVEQTIINNDADGDGICDADEVLGCTDELACNFDSAATDDDGLCQFSSDDMAFTGNCGLDHEDTILVCSLMDYDGLMPTCWPSLTGTFADSSVTISQNDGPCTTSAPQPHENGTHCNGQAPYIMEIYNFLGDETLFLSNSADGNFTYILGDTLIWTSTIAIDTSISNGFNVEIVYGPAMSWNEWQSQPFPTAYKRDCGSLIDDHENWDYRIVAQGVMTGFGQFEGVEYQINHAPSNLYYAHQFGYAANNANNNHGGSGWLSLSNETEWYSADWKVDITCQSTKLWNFVASDDCQNQISHQITVLEAGPTDGPAVPVITSDAHDLEVSSDGLGNTAELEAWLANNGGAEASSFCGALTWNNDFTDLVETCGTTGYATVTFTATDEAGNSVSTQATFATTDDFAPVITAPSSITYPCDEVVLESLLWGPQGYSSYYSVDDVSEVTTTIEDTLISTEPCGGVIERTYTPIDACENIGYPFTQIITLTDDEAPTASITCPSDIELGVDQECSANTTVGHLGMAAALVSDNCDSNATVNITWEDGGIMEPCVGSYEFIRTFSAYAVDDCDNTSIATCTQTIVVVDVTPPSLTTASLDDVSVELNEFCDYDTSVDGLGTVDFAAGDDCSDVTVEVTHYDGPFLWTGGTDDIVVEGTYLFERVFTVIATDDCGNSNWDTQTQIVQAFDVTPPSFDGSIQEFGIYCENANSLASCVEYDDESLYGIQVQDNCDSEVNVTILSSTLISGAAEFNIFRVYQATDDNGNTSTFEQVIYVTSPIECSDPAACNYEEGSEGTDDCDYSCYGCTDPFACNYSPQATTPDFSCEYNSCAGCTDPGACNFDSGATINNGDCFYYGPILDCDGQCINDTDGDGVCDENEILGCQDPEACNYESLATDPDECTYPASAYTLCDGTCINDTDGDEVCDEEEVVGCQDPLACDFDVLATDNGTCSYPAEAYLDCEGDCLNDADGDGICDELEIPGCPDPSACNFESEATDDDGSCVPSGCMDSDACNYLPTAGCDDGNCDYSCCPGPGCCLDGTVWDYDSQGCIVANPTDVDLDGCVGVSDVLEILANFGACFNIEPEAEWMCGDTLEYWGYWYETVEIGNQCWFGENLQTPKYQNGDAIPSDLSDSDWVNTTSGAVATFDASEYGRLYNWHSVNDTRNLCADEWHVPSDSDWMALEMTLGMSASSADSLGWRGTDEGTKLKSTLGWNNNGNGSDQFLFTAKPGGNRMHALGIFLEQGTDAIFWTSTPVSINNYAFSRSLNWSRTTIKRHDSGHGKNYGFSVRCVKD